MNYSNIQDVWGHHNTHPDHNDYRNNINHINTTNKQHTHHQNDQINDYFIESFDSSEHQYFQHMDHHNNQRPKKQDPDIEQILAKIFNSKNLLNQLVDKLVDNDHFVEIAKSKLNKKNNREYFKLSSFFEISNHNKEIVVLILTGSFLILFIDILIQFVHNVKK